MLLLEKLANIDKPKITALSNGQASSIQEIWEKLILPYIPQRDVVLRWHDILMEYISSQHPTFAIRGYNSFPPKHYTNLRRGFLTYTKEFSFFYTDNFFAAYVQKLIIDGFIPTINEFLSAFDTRQFPSRFGMNTAEERELLAVKQGKDPKINAAGFKLAHIIPVGKGYNYRGKILGISDILAKYFPNGNRDDWKFVQDQTGNFFRRDMIIDKDAKQFAIAHFLRFIHPFNYFLCPKKNCEHNDKCKELAEYFPLLAYAHDYILDKYGNIYREYLSYIMPDNFFYSNLFENSKSEINIQYGLNLNMDNFNSVHHKNNFHIGESHEIQENNTINYFEKHVEMLKEYLSNPHTSFRKLEVKYLGIDSAERGGGFISKKIINFFGITAEYKGILTQYSLDMLIDKTNGILKKTFQKLKHLLQKN